MDEEWKPSSTSTSSSSSTSTTATSEDEMERRKKKYSEDEWVEQRIRAELDEINREVQIYIAEVLPELWHSGVLKSMQLPTSSATSTSSSASSFISTLIDSILSWFPSSFQEIHASRSWTPYINAYYQLLYEKWVKERHEKLTLVRCKKSLTVLMVLEKEKQAQEELKNKQYVSPPQQQQQPQQAQASTSISSSSPLPIASSTPLPPTRADAASASSATAATTTVASLPLPTLSIAADMLSLLTLHEQCYTLQQLELESAAASASSNSLSTVLSKYDALIHTIQQYPLHYPKPSSSSSSSSSSSIPLVTPIPAIVYHPLHTITSVEQAQHILTQLKIYYQQINKTTTTSTSTTPPSSSSSSTAAATTPPVPLPTLSTSLEILTLLTLAEKCHTLQQLEAATAAAAAASSTAPSTTTTTTAAINNNNNTNNNFHRTELFTAAEIEIRQQLSPFLTYGSPTFFEQLASLQRQQSQQRIQQLAEAQYIHAYSTRLDIIRQPLVMKYEYHLQQQLQYYRQVHQQQMKMYLVDLENNILEGELIPYIKHVYTEQLLPFHPRVREYQQEFQNVVNYQQVTTAINQMALLSKVLDNISSSSSAAATAPHQQQRQSNEDSSWTQLTNNIATQDPLIQLAIQSVPPSVFTHGVTSMEDLTTRFHRVWNKCITQAYVPASTTTATSGATAGTATATSSSSDNVSFGSIWLQAIGWIFSKLTSKIELIPTDPNPIASSSSAPSSSSSSSSSSFSVQRDHDLYHLTLAHRSLIQYHSLSQAVDHLHQCSPHIQLLATSWIQLASERIQLEQAITIVKARCTALALDT